VGAALHAIDSEVVGAVSVSAPASRLSNKELSQVGSLVRRAASGISALLGADGMLQTSSAARKA